MRRNGDRRRAARRMLMAVAMGALCALVTDGVGDIGGSASAADWRSELIIDTRAGPVRFEVELAADEASRERGLMFRKELPEHRGMLFDFETPQPVSFWMRNTLIPLDMIFIAQNGRVVRVHERARPHDETPISSGAPILGVLEIAGGEARRLGIAQGDMVRHPMFNRQR